MAEERPSRRRYLHLNGGSVPGCIGGDLKYGMETTSFKPIHIVPSIAEESSGPSYSVVRLCDSLIAAGLEVTLATLDRPPLPSQPSFLKSFPLGAGPPRLGRSPALRRWLGEQVLSKNVDVFHSHGMWRMSAVYPGWVAGKENVGYVVSPRGSLSEWAMQSGSRVKRLFWPLLQRPTLTRATCFHATAESEYEDIRRLGFHQPVAIIPNGIDIPDLPEKDSGDSRTLLFLGRIHPKKGLDILLPAWREVQGLFPEWRLIIAGSDVGYCEKGGYLENMRRLAEKLYLKRIEFVGELNGYRKLQAYHSADLFVLPSHSENFGNTVAEALSTGTPAIVTRGAPWAGLNMKNAGWWIERGVEPLIACMKEAMALSRDRILQMGRAGREWMLKDYSWERIGSMMSETYRWFAWPESAPPGWVRVD